MPNDVKWRDREKLSDITKNLITSEKKLTWLFGKTKKKDKLPYNRFQARDRLSKIDKWLKSNSNANFSPGTRKHPKNLWKCVKLNFIKWSDCYGSFQKELKLGSFYFTPFNHKSKFHNFYVSLVATGNANAANEDLTIGQMCASTQK